MNAAKTGVIAEFKTGYLQIAEKLDIRVVGGTDSGLRDSSLKGYAPGRLVKIGTATVGGQSLPSIVASNATASSVGDATHIIAQSDDTIRDVPGDYNYAEKYSSLPNEICKNTGTSNAGGDAKTVAVYKIVNADDVKLISLD